MKNVVLQQSESTVDGLTMLQTFSLLHKPFKSILKKTSPKESSWAFKLHLTNLQLLMIGIGGGPWKSGDPFQDTISRKK